MVPTFVAADPANFRTALKRETFEGALAQLTGTGHRLADAQVVDGFARASSARGLTTKTAAEVGAKTLGSTTGDLVFTAVTPCRIVDTRVAGGAIGANNSRNFLGLAINAGANFTSQGGSATNCDVAAVGASAIAINVTAVTPTGAGYATVYRSGDARPLAASVNYTAGAIVNNSVVVGVPNPLALTDFTIYTFAQSDYVVDIVGYFSPPQATPLDCISTGTPASFTIPAHSTNFFNNPACPAGYKAVTPYLSLIHIYYVIDIVGYFAAPEATELECTSTFVTQNVAANDIFDMEIPSCPTGYHVTGAGCRTPGFDEASWGINGLYRASASDPLGAFCSGRNNTNGIISVQGTAECCRVPGR